ncbi:hypothetical protein [Streptomyces sp. HNM0574]|uniref:hypothetical protein n=1 Tax=Streptomyces sp. HNM0574 TaxID=2714954 RepID=UPI00146A89FA|nr:hypothetical protein [Streptomyces sp. HNM0574]NLU70097.1 hypothetical protein [Streptomyces sp. HNM0574]
MNRTRKSFAVWTVTVVALPVVFGLTALVSGTASAVAGTVGPLDNHVSSQEA